MNNKNYLKTALGRLSLYNAAKELFDKYYSHPQIVKMLGDYADDQALLIVIVDKAMRESWDRLLNEAIKLLALNWRRDEVIDKLSKKETDREVIELFIDNYIDRPVEFINVRADLIRKVKFWTRIIIYPLVISLSIYFNEVNFFVLVGALFGFEFLLIFGFKYIFKRRLKFKIYRDRFIQFERLKKFKLMTRIKILFSEKNKNVLNVYCTAGYPQLGSTIEVLKSLQKNGADLVEIGMPYSDPLADGPVIQQSSMIALQNGMTIQKLFEQLKDIRKEIHLPLILMGYLNPILQYGFERFCEHTAETGVDGLILPDLPEYEFENEYGPFIKKHGLDFIFLITPETSEERIRKIDELSSGFIYAVSSSSTTGNNKEIAQQEDYFLKLQKMNLKNPVLVGFGIKDKQTFQTACKYTNGAIIGSAYIKALQTATDIESATEQFLNDILR